MSNGEDVLDNWEEIDEAGLTNTLQKIQAERQKESINISLANSSETCIRDNSNRNISENLEFNNTTKDLFGGGEDEATSPAMKLLQRSSSTNSGGFDDTFDSKVPDSSRSPLDDMSSSFTPVMMLLNKPTDEYASANYTTPMQAVKILRRPTQNVERRNNDQKPKAPLKTLKQREQEYAEARLRILGSAKNPEDEKNLNANAATQTSIPGTVSTTNGTNVGTNLTPALASTSVTVGTTPPPTTTAAAAAAVPIKKQSAANQTAPANQATPATNSASGRSKGNSNNGQKSKTNNPSAVEPMNMKNHFYSQQQQQQQQNLMQQAGFFQHPAQAPFMNNLPHHPLLSFPNAMNNSRLAMTPLLAAQNNHPLQQIKNLSPTLVHANVNHRNHHYQKQSPHLPHNNKPSTSWSPSRTTSNRGQQQDSILRMPKGPDGSVGFQMRR